MVVATTNARPVEKMITGTRPGKALAHRFVAGDTLNEAIPVAKRLNADGMKVSLDLLGEEVHDVASAQRATAEYLECLDRIEVEGVDSNISIKLTQLGLSIDESMAMESIGRLAERASRCGTTVTIDMEDSRYTEATVRAYAKSQAEHGNLGMAIQACMRRTSADLDDVMELGGHIRLCKGAYVEPPEVAFQSGAEVDDAYAAALRKLMGNETVKPAVATHDQDLIDLTLELAPARQGYFEFQMLYGVRPSLQKELVAAGHPLRVYLPFGSQWYPYLTRRLAERPSNAWFFVRAAFGS